MTPPAIDVHTHFTPPAVVDWFRDGGNPLGATVQRRDDGVDGVVHEGRWFPVERAQYDVDEWLRRMTAAGITGAVLSPTPWLFFYQTNAELAAAHCRRVNEGMAEAVQRLGPNYTAMALVPLQDPKLAANELRYARDELGLRGVEIGCRVDDRELDDGFDAFFEAAADMNVPVFLHPLGWPWRLSRYYLSNLIGVPTDTAIGCASLIFGGVLERHPALRVLFSHGGGAAPILFGRWSHGYDVRPESKKLARPPREYLGQIYWDTITHDPAVLRYLVEMSPDGHVLLGTDFPFDMADMTPQATIAAARFDEAEQASLAARAAAELYQMPRWLEPCPNP